MTSLNGYKTYIVCAITFVYAASAWYLGNMDANAAMAMILASLGGASIRHGINSAQQ